MAIKTIPLRDVDEYTENIYEAVCVMSGQARRVLNDRIVGRSLREAETEEYGVFDEIEEKTPEDYEEKEKETTEAIAQFLSGDIAWRRRENF